MAEIPDELTVKRIKDLRMKGRNLDAWEVMKDLAPPEEWPKAEDRAMAAVVLERLGAYDRAQRLCYREWRRKKTRGAVRGQMFFYVANCRPAYITWQWLQKHAPEDGEGKEEHSDHQARLATVLMQMRDFERAEECLVRGREGRDEARWIDLLRADMLIRQDRREDALAMTEEVVRADPEYISAIRAKSELLSELGRDEEALEVLREGLQRLQSGTLALPLVNLLIELKRYEEAAEALDLYEKLTPLRETDFNDWVYGRRCVLASHRNDPAEAQAWAEKVEKNGFYKLVAEKLKGRKEAPKRHLLEVPFVRQHHSTCAPASVTSVALYWGKDVGHLELADAICYDGTPDYKERGWAEKNGWVTREFKVTLESAKLLLDEGMPFVMNTVAPGNAHAQVVTGYDECRMVFFVRDPGNRHSTEFLAAEALEQQAAYGPRGLVMVPAEEGRRLEALSLPEAELYDLIHRLHTALDAHDRKRAQELLETVREDYPNHRLRWHAELSLGFYDSLQSQVLTALEEMLKMYPKEENWQTQRLGMIREMHGREAMISALREVCADKDSHPIHWRMLARELHWDDRHAAEAQRLLKRADRKQLDGISILTSGNILWWEQEHANATELYRLAACLESRNEGVVTSYFNATKWVRKTDEALIMMRRRFELEGGRSGQPGMTLYRALDQLQRPVEGLEVLEEALKRRPEDTDLVMFVAGEMISWNRIARAREILDGIQRRARSAEWHRIQARLAAYEGDVEGQMKHYQAVLEDQPLDVLAHRHMARLLEMQEGEKAGYAFLKQACDKFPYHWHLHVALLDWARSHGPEVREDAVKELIRIDPSDGWARRELAEVRKAQRRYAEAHAELDLADTLDGGDVAQYSVRASVLEDEGRRDEAREECRKAMMLDIDNGYVMRGLIRLSLNHEQRVEALGWVQAELRKQTTQGDGVTTFCEVARATLEDAELELVLREGWEQRPDLWQTGVHLAEHLRHTGREDEAVKIMKGLTERFPLMPRVWMELGLCLERQGDRKGGIEAAMKLREINPSWSWGMRTLAEMMRKTGDYAGAERVLREVLRHCPEDALCHGWLAEILWHEGNREGALQHLATAVERDPDYQWAWDMLGIWGKEAGRPECVQEAALRLQKERPGEVRTWTISAELLFESQDLEGGLAMFDKALEISPGDGKPADMKARVLALAGRFDEALKLCREHPSKALPLRHREGWILHRMGKYKEAVRVMDEALEEDPAYPWPWQLLTGWHKENDRLDLAEKACRQHARLQPAEPVPLGYLGSILEERKKRNEAKEVYKKAREVQPEYPFALQRLFWLHVEDAQWEEAAALLKQAEVHFKAVVVQSYRFIYYRQRRHWQTAREMLRMMLAQQEDEADAFYRVQETLEKIPGSELELMLKEVETVLVEGGCNVNAGSLYVEICKLTGKVPARKVMAALPQETEMGERAFKSYIHWLGDRWKETRRDVTMLCGLMERLRWRRLRKEQGEWLRRNIELYGAVTYMLTVARPPRETLEWLHDWRERKRELEPYLVNNLVLALQKAGRTEDVREAVAFGMTLANNNPIKMRFHIWAAMESLLAGDADLAMAQMDAVNPNELDGYGESLFKMMETILAYHKSEPPKFTSIQVQLVEFSGAHRRNPYMQSVIRRTCGLAGKRLRSFYPRPWYTMHRFFQRLGLS